MKKDRGIALKVIEEDSLDLDEEEIDMITRKFKKFFKKAKEISKKKNFNKDRNSDREQLTGCFKSGKHDHIMKNRPLLKENRSKNSFRDKAENRLKTLLQTGL